MIENPGSIHSLISLEPMKIPRPQFLGMEFVKTDGSTGYYRSLSSHSSRSRKLKASKETTPSFKPEMSDLNDTLSFQPIISNLDMKLPPAPNFSPNQTSSNQSEMSTIPPIRVGIADSSVDRNQNTILLPKNAKNVGNNNNNSNSNNNSNGNSTASSTISSISSSTNPPQLTSVLKQHNSGSSGAPKVSKNVVIISDK